MVFELLRTTKGGAARRVLTLLALAFTVHMPLVAPAQADPTDWARAVINEAKAAQDSVERESRRIRVASLGNEGFEAAARQRRASRERVVRIPAEVIEVRPAAKPKRVASLGSSRSDVSSTERSRREQRAERRSLSGGSVNWIASAGCLDGSLRSVVNAVASRFGPVTVNSTCRSRGHNRRVGGASKSKHLTGDAVDFRIHGNVSATYAYLRSSGSVGGLKHYGGGLFHIDNGPRRSW